jgi:hypothetical protein
MTVVLRVSNRLVCGKITKLASPGRVGVQTALQKADVTPPFLHPLIILPIHVAINLKASKGLVRFDVGGLCHGSSYNRGKNEIR